MTESCESCVFGTDPPPSRGYGLRGTILECRRHSPEAIVVGGGYFPIIEPTDWCGDYEPKPLPVLPNP